jgi:hypothetical protein
MEDAAHLGQFFGCKRDAFTLDALCLRSVKRELLRGERDLFRSKWFDYRMLHPGKATHYFLSIVNQVHSEYVCRTVDHVRGEYASCVKAADLFTLKAGQLNALWQARQVADGFGAPYEVFVRGMYAVVEKEGWQRPPFANQLAVDRLLVGGQLAWEHEREAYVRYPVHPFFKVGSSFLWKPDFDVWWVQQIWHRGSRKFQIRKAISNGWLDEQGIALAARRFFGRNTQ